VAPPGRKNGTSNARSFKRSAPEQEGFGDTLSPMGVQGASPLARVRGAEPRSLKSKPLDHPTPKQVDPVWLRAKATVRWLCAKATVRCPLGQRHPTSDFYSRFQTPTKSQQKCAEAQATAHFLELFILQTSDRSSGRYDSSVSGFGAALRTGASGRARRTGIGAPPASPPSRNSRRTGRGGAPPSGRGAPGGRPPPPPPRPGGPLRRNGLRGAGIAPIQVASRIINRPISR
jgi:hypothetical protein